jgi:hypothetical protein
VGKEACPFSFAAAKMTSGQGELPTGCPLGKYGFVIQEMESRLSLHLFVSCSD